MAALAAAVIAFSMRSAPAAMLFRVCWTASTGSNLPQLCPKRSAAEPPSVTDTMPGCGGGETGSAPPMV